MIQRCFLIVNIAIPSKAIDVDHAPLAGSGGEGVFIAGDEGGFAFGRCTLIIIWVGSFSSLFSNTDRLCGSETGSSVILKSLPVANGCSFKSEPLKVLTREV